MFSVWVRVKVRPEQDAEFRQGLRDNARHTRHDEPGCLYFDVVRLDEAGWYGFYEVYQDAHAFYVDHRRAPHYARWRRVVERTVVPGSQVVVTGDRERDLSPGGSVPGVQRTSGPSI